MAGKKEYIVLEFRKSLANDECKIRHKFFPWFATSAAAEFNTCNRITSASNVARVTKLGKGRSFALAARAVCQSDWGMMSFCTRGTEAAPYEESSGEGGQIDRQPRDRQMPRSQ